jgi:hypothetical protein
MRHIAVCSARGSSVPVWGARLAGFGRRGPRRTHLVGLSEQIVRRQSLGPLHPETSPRDSAGPLRLVVARERTSVGSPERESTNTIVAIRLLTTPDISFSM